MTRSIVKRLAIQKGIAVALSGLWQIQHEIV